MSNRLLRIVASDFNRIFDQSVHRFSSPLLTTQIARPFCPTYRFDDFFDQSFYRIQSEIAGMQDGKWKHRVNINSLKTKPEDIKIELENRNLKISGFAEIEQELINGSKFTSNGNWSETMKLPEELDLTTLKATVENDVISITADIQKTESKNEIPISNLN